MTILKRAIVCGGVVLALSACEHGDPVSSAGGEIGKSILITGADAGPVAGQLPSGNAVVSLIFGSLDPSVRDQLGRKPADATIARRTRNFRATAHYWTWTKELRDGGSTNRIDPRLPAIEASSRTADGSQYFELYQPEGSYPNKEFWEFYFIVHNLTPNTPHEVAFVHRRLTVNGELDAVERIMSGTVTQPDQLVMGPGTKATVNTDWSGTAPVGCAAFPGVTANPFVVSTDPSDAQGRLQDFDKCWQSGNGIWTKAEFDQQPKSMVGRNDDVAFSLPNYNYIEVWRGAFGTGTLVGRMQIAQDLDASGAPVKNGYAPFPEPGGNSTEAQQGPIPAVEAVASYPISNTLKSTLPGALVVPSTVVATMTNVQKLDAGTVYKAWFMNGLTGAAHEASGHYTRKEGTTTVEDVASTTTFSGGRGTITFTTTYDPAVHGAFADSLNFLVFTKETDAAAATPSISQPLWVKIFKFPPASAGGATTFGNFNRDSLPAAGDTSRHPVKFTPQGVASGGVIGDTVTMTVNIDGTATTGPVFVGSLIELRFTGLQRPPKGYEYKAYLRRKADGTLAYIGGLQGPDGSSLANADVAASGGNLGKNGIKLALLKWDAHNIAGATLCDYDKIQIYVVPKGGALYEPLAQVFNIGMPKRVLEDAIACK